MAACASKCVTGVLATAFDRFAAVSIGIARFKNDSRIDGRGHPPPEHPPRILV
jgi:hypothetical protein